MQLDDEGLVEPQERRREDDLDSPNVLHLAGTAFFCALFVLLFIQSHLVSAASIRN